MKQLLSIILTAVLLTGSALSAKGIQKSQAKVEVQEAQDELKNMSARKDLDKFMPFRESYYARVYYYKAAKYLEDGDYEKASYFAILSSTNARKSVNLAEAWQSEIEIMNTERDYYKTKGMASEILIKLGEANLKQKGKSKEFVGAITGQELFGIKRMPRSAEQLEGLSKEAITKLNKIYSVMQAVPDAVLELESFSGMDRRGTDFSEAFNNKIKDFMAEKGMDTKRIEANAKGNKKRQDVVEIKLKNISVK